nr:MAG TPA: ribosomal protein L7/L12 [Caudoviricetes sp.]
MKYDVIVTDAEDIFELDSIQDNLLRLNNISEEEVKQIVDIFGSRGLQVVLFPRLVSEE